MIKEAIDRLVGLVPPTPIEGDDLWSDRPLKLYRKPEPNATPLVFRTLTSLGDYLTQNRDRLELADLHAHVVHPARVEVRGRLTDRHDRETFASAIAVTPELPTASFHSLEFLRIALRTAFVVDESLEEVLRILENVKGETVQVSEDDGLSQVASVRRGVKPEWEKIPGDLKLRPYRTFREVDQPASPYVFRLNYNAADEMEAGLFETADVQWRIDAASDIARFLRTVVPGEVAVLA